MREFGSVTCLVLCILAAPFVHSLAERGGRSFAHACMDGGVVLALLLGLGVLETRAFVLLGFTSEEAVSIAWSWPMTLTALVVLDGAWRFYARLPYGAALRR